MKKLAVVFALAMALLLTVTAFADDPVISIDFENGAGDVELVNAEIVDDVTRGKVLKINGQGNGTARTSYGLFTTDIFENTNWENGLTVSMWIQTDVGSQTLSGTAPIYSIDIARIGYIATVCSLETTMNTDGNEPDTGISPRCWNDPVNVAGGVNKTDEGIWQLLTVVYSPDGIKIYVDGEFYADSPLGGGSMDMFLFEVEFATGLRLGAWNCDWWNYGDYQGLIDDVNVWNTALSEDDVFDLYADTKKAQTVVVKAPTVEELYTAEEHTPVYTLDFEDASALELVNAELVPGHAGNALKVSGTGVGTQGTSYGLVKTDLFKDTDWTKGMTITMWVNAAQSDTLTGMAPIYSLDIGNQGYIGLVNSLQSGINTDGNEDIGIVPRFWNDPGNQGGSVNETRVGEWDQVTVVYNNDGANNMQIYRNGELVVRPGMNLGTQFGEGTNEQFFTEQLKMVYSLRLGSWLCVWWNNGDYEGLIDDLAIYNVALNPLEAKYLFTGMPEAADEPAAEAPAEEPGAPTYPASGADGSIINGTVIGNAEGWGGNADAGAAAAFDGNPATFFDPLGVGDGFCGIDAGESYILDKVVILSRADWNARFPGAMIQGSNDGENWTTLWTSDVEGTNPDYYTVTEFENNTGYSQFRYFNETNHGDVAEVEFYGHAGSEAAEEPAEEPAAESKGFASLDEAAAAAGKTAVSAYTFVEGSNGFGGEGAENLWDGDTATKFCTNEFPVVSVVELDGVYTVNGFTMATANDNADYNGRNPNDWTISVSADGENWTELAKGDDTFFEETNFTYYNGDASAEGVSFVKFEAASSAANLFQVSELTLYGEKTAEKGAADEALDEKAEAPQTFDFGIIAAVAAVVSLGGFAVAKKRK